MMKISLFIFAIILTSNSLGQSFGYYGKKNILRVNGLGTRPMFGDIRDFHYYHNSNGQLKEKDNYFDGGLSLNYARVVGKRFAIGIEYSINLWNIPGPIVRYETVTSSSGDEHYVYKLKHEMLDVQTQNFMPKVHFSPGKSLFLPIDCEFGVAYAQTKIKEKNYLSEEVKIEDDYYTSEFQKNYQANRLYHSLTVLYGINSKIPINRSLFFNFGIRYTFNFDAVILDGDTSLDNGFGGEWYSLIARRRAASLLTANLGFMIVF